MTRLYRALLRLYPAGFRAEYGGEMYSIFARRRGDATGPLAVLALWIETVLDALRNAIPLHWDILRQDLRYTARTLARSPGFTVTAILVAGLGIGANTAVFTVTDHVLIRPLPFSEPERLVKLWESVDGYAFTEVSPPNFRDWHDMSSAFQAMGAYNNISVNVVGQGEPQRLEGSAVTAELLPMLGVQPALGRLFAAEEDREGAEGTLLLSHHVWQTAFGGDPGVLGRKVLLDNEPYVVIGVMPRAFHFPSRDTDIWTAARFGASDFENRDDNYLYVIGRLRPGVTLDRAREEMRVIAERLERAYPVENGRTGVTAHLLRDQVSDQARLLLAALVGAALCVLLIACTNLANLLLARAMARRKELAVRSSLGAGRERLVRQLLTESLTLALLGGAFGVLVASLVLPLLSRLVPTTLPIAESPSLDPRVLVVALLLTLVTGLGFGVVPALRGGRADMDGLREGARSGVGGRRERLRSALVVVEVMASVVLLVSSGLLIRALWQLQGTDPGFRTEGVLTLRTWLPLPKYDSVARREQFYGRVLTEARALPGVSGAAYTSFAPMVMRGGIWKVAIKGREQSESESRSVSLRFVTPGFFATLGVPIRTGRDVSEQDTRDQPFAAVVSESFARSYWPGENPIGQRFEVAFFERTVVGVVGDVRVRGLEQESEPQVYLPYKQVPDGGLSFYTPKDLVIRSAGDPTALAPALRRIIRAADPEQAISDVRTLADLVESDTGARRVQIRVLGAFALVAFLLAGIGLYGLLSFTVSQRTHEIGVRMALGAQARDILTMVLREGVLLAAAGVVLGAGLGYLAGRSLEAILVGVKPADIATFAAAAALSLAMAAVGSLIPALRAVRVDPTTVIREG